MAFLASWTTGPQRAVLGCRVVRPHYPVSAVVLSERLADDHAVALPGGERRQSHGGRDGKNSRRHSPHRMAVGQRAEGGDLEPRVQTDEHGALSIGVRWITNVGRSIGGRG